MLVLIQVVTIYRAFAGWLLYFRKDFEKRLVFFTAFFYLTAFAVMNLGIPFFQVYPINLFAWVLIGLVWVLSIDGYDEKKTSLLNSWSKFAKGLVGK